jgi:pimeloyl-ACP methyl ester carboxylesterase
MKHIYLFSGLGVDRRAYQNIDLSGFEITFIEWIKPIQNESLANYAVRLTKQITRSEFILVGVSFGGMLAVEIAKIITPVKTIIISSAKTSAEIPLPFRFFGRLRLHYLIPTKFLKKPNCINYWLFGIDTIKNKKLLADILHDTDPEFFRWAMKQIILWENKTVPNNVIHVHGTDDKILPYRFVHCGITIPDAGHFMVVDKADQLTPILRNLLA